MKTAKEEIDELVDNFMKSFKEEDCTQEKIDSKTKEFQTTLENHPSFKELSVYDLSQLISRIASLGFDGMS